MSAAHNRLVPVILSGGAGTRLWPASRHDRPKQFLPLVNGKTTFSDTLARISNPRQYAPPIVVTSRSFGFLVASELQAAGLAGRIVMEPMRRDSGPAIAVAAVRAEQEHPGSLMLVLAADHVVTEADAFNEAVTAGQAAATAGRIVTFGIRPDRPSPNYGYIEPGAAIDGRVHAVKRFIEKPDASRAQLLISQGCLWNSGNFLFRSDVLLAELARLEPAMLEAAEAAVRMARIETTGSFIFETLDAKAFAGAPAKSIDYAVMERTSLAAVIPAEYGWSDLGSWEALWEILTKDEHGNVVAGAATTHNATNSYVSSDGPFTALVGLDNVVVVATQDAVLVAPRGAAAEIKPIVAALETSEKLRHLALRHKQTHLAWGSQSELASTDAARIRIVELKAGASWTSEGPCEGPTMITVVAGEASSGSAGEVSEALKPGQCRWFAAGETAMLSNAGETLLQVLELQIRPPR